MPLFYQRCNTFWVHFLFILWITIFQKINIFIQSLIYTQHIIPNNTYAFLQYLKFIDIFICTTISAYGKIARNNTLQ
jgi:hypothetical protein